MRSSGDGVRTARALLHHSQLQIPNPTPSRSSQLHAAACAVLCGGRQRAQHLVTPSPHPCTRRTSPHFAMLHPPAAPSGLWEQGRIRLHFANTRTPTHTAAPPPSPWATAARHNFVLGLCDALCATHTTPAPIVLQFSPEPPAAHTHTPSPHMQLHCHACRLRAPGIHRCISCLACYNARPRLLPASTLVSNRARSPLSPSPIAGRA